MDGQFHWGVYKLMKFKVVGSVGISLLAIYALHWSRSPDSRGLASVRTLSTPNQIISWLPARQRAGVEEYMEMIGLGHYDSDKNSIWGSNAGLVNYNQGLLEKNPCFRQLAEDFYSSVSTYGQSSSGHGNLTHSLLDSTENNKGLKSGWLWDLALKYADNNANLAMTLIGLCGHDNMHQFPSDPSQTRVECGSSMSNMFVQGSLGAETILPEATKRRVIAVQAPNSGGRKLPSKYFHTMGAAYLSCSLIRAGFPGFFVRRLQVAAARTYRFSRLCGTIKNYEFLLPAREMSFESFSQRLNQYREDPTVCEFSHDEEGSSNVTPACDFLLRLERQIGDASSSGPTAQRAFERLRARLDAAAIFKQQVLNGRPCGGMQYTERINRRLNHFQARGDCGSELSQKRCELARKTIKTWLVDMEWSQVQHRQGADFASQHCQRDPNFINENLEKFSCKALKGKSEHHGSDSPSSSRF